MTWVGKQASLRETPRLFPFHLFLSRPRLFHTMPSSFSFLFTSWLGMLLLLIILGVVLPWVIFVVSTNLAWYLVYGPVLNPTSCG